MISEEVKEKLDAHWTFINKIAKLAYELGQVCSLDWSVIEPLAAELYLPAIHHGYKHAKEETK